MADRAALAADNSKVGAEFLDPDEDQAKPGQPGAPPPPPAVVEERPANAGYVPGYRRDPAISLSPHAPEAPSALPGALTPPFGAPLFGNDLKFTFSGYLQAPLYMTIGQREIALVGQKKTTIHGDAVVPGGSFGFFDHTMTVPFSWSQLGFTVGNDKVKATAIIGSWSFSEPNQSAGFFQLAAKAWFTDAYLTYTPHVEPVKLRFQVGSYPERYGAMSRYDSGRYAIPLIGAIYGTGATATVELPFVGDWTAKFEGGFKGSLNRVPVGIVSDSSNNSARVNEGATFAGHGHFGINYAGFDATVHYIHVFEQDDTADHIIDPATKQIDLDGSVDIIGGDIRGDLGRFGYIYLGASHIKAKNAASLQNLVQVINASVGKDFTERFWGWGSGGNGGFTLAGAQYSLSLGTLLRYPDEFWGEGPDLNISLFGLFGRSESAFKDTYAQVEPLVRQLNIPMFDGRTMLKYGAEVTYTPLSWLGLSFRADHVLPDTRDGTQSFGVLSPKIIFHGDWQAREALTLQYSGYLFGQDVIVVGDNRLTGSHFNRPDRHLLALIGNLWW